MKELSPTATRPARELAVEALTRSNEEMRESLENEGRLASFAAAIAVNDAALSALRAELAAVPQQPDEWLKEATRLADEAVCLGTPHKTNVAYAALLSHLAARPAVPQEPTHQQLMAFYGVDSLTALVEVQARSIERLQERLSAAEGNPFKHQQVRKA